MRPDPGWVVVALDLSTTAAKAVAFDAHGSILGSARAPLETVSPRPGWQEQEAASWWTAACASLRALTSTLAPDRLAAIAITHQRETFVCLDEHGEPLRPAILWLDSRPTAQVEELGSEEVHRISGRQPSTTASLYKLAWLGEHEPAVMARTAMVADVHAFLVHRLTGRWLTSWASADPMGLVDLRSFEYSGPLLRLAGIEADQLPGLVPPASGIGEVTAEAARATGLPAGLPVIAGAGDGQCAALGSAVVGPGEVSLNLGTSVTLGLHSDEYRTGEAFRTLASAVPERWMLEAALASGTHSIEWFRKQVMRDAFPSALSRVESEAESVPAGAEGLLFLPYLVRAETPFWDPAARGAWVGLRDHHGWVHPSRALPEVTPLEQAMVLSMIEAETGVAAASVRVMGGGARSGLWTRILADVLEAPTYVSEVHDATALGAAILAAVSLGLEGETSVTDTARRMSRGWRQLPPRPGGRAAYGRSSRAYRMLYPALADVFAEIER